MAGVEGAVEVGRGGVAVVYRARQATFGRDVAVKVVTVAGVDESARERFTAECQALGSTAHHPNIVSVFDAGTTASGLPFLVMEYLPHGSLDTQLSRRGRLPALEVAALGIQLAGALESAHRVGVLHRDVKPGNVLLSDFGSPLLADFGIARVADRGELTATGMVAGTPAHTAPEIFAGARPSPRSDLYSLASTLYTLLAGSPPFVTAERDVLALVRRVAEEPVPDLGRHGVPRVMTEVLEWGLAKDPDDRPETVAAFGDGLRDVERSLGGGPTSMLVIGEAPAGGGRDPQATRPVLPRPFQPGREASPSPRPFRPRRRQPPPTHAPDVPEPPRTEVTPPTRVAQAPSPSAPVDRPVASPPSGHATPVPAASSRPAKPSNTWIYVVVLVALVFVASIIGGIVLARATG